MLIILELAFHLVFLKGGIYNQLQGDNLVTAVLTGPGIVFIQSLPFHRLSQRIARYILVAAWTIYSQLWSSKRAGLCLASLLGTILSLALFVLKEVVTELPPILLQGCDISKHEGQSEVLPSNSDFLLSCLRCGCVIVNLDGHMKFFFVLGFHRKSRRCSLTSEFRCQNRE